jgi:hypothetical protein
MYWKKYNSGEDSEKSKYVMIPTQQDQKSTRRGGHEPKSWVSEDVRPEAPGPVLAPDRKDLGFRASIEYGQIQVAASIVDAPSILISGILISVEDIVNDQICKCEEEAGNTSGMRLVFVTR